MDISITVAYGQQQQTNFTVLDGETINLQLTITDQLKTPINLTGCTFKARIGFPTPLDLSTSNGYITITNPTAGIVTLGHS